VALQATALDLWHQPRNNRSHLGHWETIYMVFNDFATRFAAMMVLRLPRGYDLLKSQRRYTVLYWMRRPHEDDFRALPLLKFSNRPLLVDVGVNVGQSVLSL
jgi:hypothetical protein